MKQTIITILIAVLLIGCNPASVTPDKKPTEPEVAPTEEIIPTQVPTHVPTDTPLPTEMPVPPTPTTPPKKEITDTSEEYLPGYLDVLSVNYYLMDETLVAELVLRDLPETLTFNRPHVKLNRMEYKWDIFVDLDNDPSTGSTIVGQEGADINLAAAYFLFEESDPVEDRIENMVQVNLMETNKNEPGWNFVERADLIVDPEKNTLILKGNVPRFSEDSRVLFQTAENHPELGYVTDQLD